MISEDMNLLNSYPDFQKDVLDVFNCHIEFYGMTYAVEGDRLVIMENKYCVIRFHMYQYELGVMMSPKRDNHDGFHEVAPYGTNYGIGRRPRTYYGKESSIRRLLSWYSRLLFFSPTNRVLHGDFSLFEKHDRIRAALNSVKTFPFPS
jgi:hypothetical protein